MKMVDWIGLNWGGGRLIKTSIFVAFVIHKEKKNVQNNKGERKKEIQYLKVIFRIANCKFKSSVIHTEWIELLIN